MLGKKLGAQYALYLCSMVLLTALISMPFFRLNFGQGQGSGSLSELYQTVLDIIPSNLFTPFSRGNTLQILMVAITDKYHISREFANFAVPFGQILYKPATAIMYWFTALCVAERSGIPVSITWLITVSVMCLILSTATPPIPGGTTATKLGMVTAGEGSEQQ